MLKCLCISGHAGFLDDAFIKFIDKTDSSDPLEREDYWRLLCFPSKILLNIICHYIYKIQLILNFDDINFSKYWLVCRIWKFGHNYYCSLYGNTLWQWFLSSGYLLISLHCSQLTGFCVMQSFSGGIFEQIIMSFLKRLLVEALFMQRSVYWFAQQTNCMVSVQNEFLLRVFLLKRLFNCSYQFDLLMLSMDLYNVFSAILDIFDEFIIFVIIIVTITIIISIFLLLLSSQFLLLVQLQLSLFFGFIAFPYFWLINTSLKRCFINIKSKRKKIQLLNLSYSCNYCLGYLFQIISFKLFDNFVLQIIM